jgi:hypothetical protein
MLIIFFKKIKQLTKRVIFFKMIKSIFFFEFKFLFREKIKKKKTNMGHYSFCTQNLKIKN